MSRRRAFTLLELLCTIAIIGILAALLLPVLQRGQAAAKRAACASNLKEMGVAFHAWAHEHGDLFPMQVSTNRGGTLEFARATALNPDVSFTFRHFQALSNELATPKVLRCQAEKAGAPATDFAALHNGQVSYWIHPGVAFGQADSPIAGDRNVRTSGRIAWTFIQFSAVDAVEFSAELHGHRGNVLFGDGHVDMLDGTALRNALASGTNSFDITLSLPAIDIALVPEEDERANGQSEREPSQINSLGLSPAGPHGQGDSTNVSITTVPNRGEARAESGDRRRALNVGQGAGSNMAAIIPDGTIATASVPTAVTNAAIPAAGAGNTVEGKQPGNALIEFLAGLAHAVTKGTYWLLFLLLLALVAFEVARRRARRKRRNLD